MSATRRAEWRQTRFVATLRGPATRERSVRRAGLWRWMPATIALSGLLAICEAVYRALPSYDASQVAAWASTNVARLGSEPLGPLVASAFVVDDHPLVWLLLCAAALGAYERRVGSWQVLVVAATAHVTGTLLSESIVWWRVHIHDLPGSAREQLDIGVSYVVVGVLAATLVVAQRRVRLLVGAVLLALVPLLLDGLPALDVAAVGHLTAGIAGAAAGWLIRPSARDRPAEPGGPGDVTRSLGAKQVRAPR